MGWWDQNRSGVSFAKDENDLIWGDRPADLLDRVLDRINDELFTDQEKS